jgi:hypothetical protein
VFWYTGICMAYFYFKHSCKRLRDSAVYWRLISGLVMPMGSLLPRISTRILMFQKRLLSFLSASLWYPAALVNLRFVSTPPLSPRLLHPRRLVQPITHQASMWKASNLSSAPWPQLPVPNFRLSLSSSNKKNRNKKEQRKSQVNR